MVRTSQVAARRLSLRNRSNFKKIYRYTFNEINLCNKFYQPNTCYFHWPERRFGWPISQAFQSSTPVPQGGPVTCHWPVRRWPERLRPVFICATMI